MTTTVSQRLDALVERAEETLRQRAAGEPIRVQVGSATCEQAAGSDQVLDEFRKHIAASGRHDIVLHQTGCTGRCSCEPIVGVMMPGQMPVKYQRVDRQLVHAIFTQHVQQGKPVLEHVLDGPIEALAPHELLICGSVRCGWKGPQPFDQVLAEKPAAAGLTSEQVRVTQASCFSTATRPRPAPSRTCWSGPTRCCTVSRTRPSWKKSSASI